MKPVDISVISESVQFIFNLLNVVDTKHFLFPLMKRVNLSRTPCILSIYTCIYTKFLFRVACAFHCVSP